MALYTLHGLSLTVQQAGQKTGEHLSQLLQGLACVRTDALVPHPSLSLAIRLNTRGCHVPHLAREVLRAEGFRGLAVEDDFYLTDGASLLHLQALQGRGTAHLAPSFFVKPALLQRNFWAFGLLKLLRPMGMYSLHAASVVTPHGGGLLLVGGSGSGKSTLTIGLIRQGWRYLSDDAVLLRYQREAVEALAFRMRFYIDTSAAERYADLSLGEEEPDTAGGRRRQVRIGDAYPGQYVPGCVPRVLLFPRVVSCPHSSLRPLDRHATLRALLAKSGPQLFDRGTMPPHLELLKRLVHQATAYELTAGRDLYQHPAALERLLTAAEGEDRWLASSSS